MRTNGTDCSPSSSACTTKERRKGSLQKKDRERECSAVNLSTSERCRLKQRVARRVAAYATFSPGTRVLFVPYNNRLTRHHGSKFLHIITSTVINDIIVNDSSFIAASSNTNHTTLIKALTMEASRTTAKASSLRWQILRQALLRRPPPLIPVDDDAVLASGSLKRPGQAREARMCYTLPVDGAPRIFLTQRVNERADLGDFEICNRYNIDNTGLVCHWPSEDVLAYFCLSQADMFRYKRVIELGSGYGLAGLVIAAITEASEVVISDGNPQVVDYIQRNIDANTGAFGATRVKSMTLHWDQEEIPNLSNAFDVIIASDCTFFKEFHNGLARIIKLLLNKAGPSQAIFFSPKRGNSLDKFLETINQNGLFFSVTENYDAEVWKRHQAFMDCKNSWTSYERDHCYPVMVRITL
ncbi:hypothetical protein FH972_006983 [Carpinus fangiana]|uniref:Calmodulin-lysine N-methyltransferase n=1 Tax=Carpinus fangiana TaxID=176857 RepID=A0A5N6QVS1_9ROSI|nr:hypothetical protein FH972_006983 [Carpinus fangiana]